MDEFREIAESLKLEMAAEVIEPLNALIAKVVADARKAEEKIGSAPVQHAVAALTMWLIDHLREGQIATAAAVAILQLAGVDTSVSKVKGEVG